MSYLPELRKLGIMQGGNFEGVRRTILEASHYLDAVYESADSDAVVFDGYDDFLLLLASRLDIPVTREIKLDELNTIQKEKLLSKIEAFYRLCQELQSSNLANCHGVDTNIFFPLRGESIKVPAHVCSGCLPEKLSDCAEVSLTVKFGYWAGMSERSRRTARRRLHIPEPADIILPMSILTELVQELAVADAEISEVSNDEVDDDALFEQYLSERAG